MSKYEYRNPWHKESEGRDSEFFRTDVEPIEYRGATIFFYSHGRADYVKDGIAFAQRGAKTLVGAKYWIDLVLAGEDVYVAPDFSRRPL